MQDARRNQAQHELRAVDVHRVPGVVAALIARHDREARRQQIDDLPFAFIAPLRAEHREIHIGLRFYFVTADSRHLVTIATHRREIVRARTSARVVKRKIFHFRLTTCAPLLKVYSFGRDDADAAIQLSRAAIARGARRVAVAHSRARRRMRQRPHDAAAAAARTARPHARRSTSTSSARRRRPSGSCARSSASSPFPVSEPAPAGARARVRRHARLSSCRARTGSGEPATFLLDEFLELRTFESFPGLRRVLHDLVDGLAASGNRFVLTSRYVGAHAAAAARPLGALRSHPHAGADRRRHARHPRAVAAGRRADDADDLARTVQALADGRPGLRPRARRRARRDARARRRPGVSDPISALAALLAPEGRLAQALQLLLRAAPAPRARLRRAQGDPRDSRRRGRADAHRNLAAPAAHARIDEGLPVVARGRRPGHRRGRSATASPIRCCASGCACTAARRRRPKTTSRAKCTATRCRACRSSRNRASSREAAYAMASAGGGSGIIEID